MRKKNKELENLSNRITDRTKDLIGTKKELSDNLKELKDLKKQVNNLKVKNNELENEVIAMRNEVEALKNPSVAEPEKPGPQKEVERGEPIESTMDSTYSEVHTTTGGIFGDSEGETETPNAQGNMPQKGARKKNPKKKENKQPVVDLVSSEESHDSDQDRKDTNRKKKSNKSKQDIQAIEMEKNFEKLLEDQKKRHEEELSKLRIELEKKNKEELEELKKNKLAFGQTRFPAAADPIEHISEENFLLQIFAKMDTFMI